MFSESPLNLNNGKYESAVEDSHRYKLKNVELHKTGHFAYREIIDQIVREHKVE